MKKEFIRHSHWCCFLKVFCGYKESYFTVWCLVVENNFLENILDYVYGQSQGRNVPGFGGWLMAVPGKGLVTQWYKFEGHVSVSSLICCLSQFWSIKTHALTFFFFVITEKTEHCGHPSEPDGKKHFRLSGEDICADYSQKVIIY